MNVSELIDKLNTITDKNQKVLVWKEGDVDELKEEDIVEFNNRIVFYKDVEELFNQKQKQLDEIERYRTEQKSKKSKLWGNPQNPIPPN